MQLQLLFGKIWNMGIFYLMFGATSKISTNRVNDYSNTSRPYVY
jgi:hypothetical protein